MKAKRTSLASQIVAAVWIAVWSGLKFFRNDSSVHDIMLSGLAIATCFTPVYFSIIMDKIKTIRFGNECGEE